MIGLALAGLAALAACATPSGDGAGGTRAPNALTAAERAEGWRLLFNGSDFRGWRGLGRDTVPTAHWVIQDGGVLHKRPSGNVPLAPDGQPIGGGDLMTIDTFGDFELAFEWKVSHAANSGIKYNVSEAFSLANSGAHAALGFEYQILDDDNHPDAKMGIAGNRTAAGLYDLIGPSAKRTRPVGEWNEGRIVFRGNHGEHWLNGEKVVEYDLGTARMDALLAASKYAPIRGFADRRRGHIVLQDHNDAVWYRNVKIRELR